MIIMASFQRYEAFFFFFGTLLSISLITTVVIIGKINIRQMITPNFMINGSGRMKAITVIILMMMYRPRKRVMRIL